MITIQFVMLVTLGFLAATLISFLLAPAYRRRVARLAVDEIRRALPLTEQEIRADKDRLRAECAMLIHNLEAKVEEATLAAARGNIEVNRRDAAISSLEAEIDRMEEALQEHENARRVLEHAVTDRLPRVEQRLAYARDALAERDRDISELTASAAKQSRALDEANQINAQQREDMLRLTSGGTRGRGRDPMKDLRFDGEAALRAELEALRGQAREQSLLITRLEGHLARVGETAAVLSPASDHDREVAKLKQDLAEAEAALKSARSVTATSEADQEAGAAELRTLRAKVEDQSAEMARLAAALETWEAGETKQGMLKDSKLALKARVGALEAQGDQQTKTIQALRAEVAAANERLARQAAHFRDEVRRLGGNAAASPGVPAAKRAAASQPERRTLTERINQFDAGEAPRNSAKVTGFLRALAGTQPQEPDQDLDGKADVAEPAGGEPPQEKPQPTRKPRLLDRLTGLDKTPA